MTSVTPDGEARIVHATVVSLDGRGVIISGPSGSGKTLLALELLQRCRAAGVAAKLVADDYAYLSLHRDGHAVARVPEAIAHKVELRGFGIAGLDPERCQDETAIALAVRLVDRAEADRVADPDRLSTLCGVAVPEILLPAREPVGSLYAVLGQLGLHNRIL